MFYSIKYLLYVYIICIGPTFTNFSIKDQLSQSYWTKRASIELLQTATLIAARSKFEDPRLGDKGYGKILKCSK